MNIIGQIDQSVFASPQRLHHRLDEYTQEFPSSAGSRARGLLALKAMNWRVAKKSVPTARDYVQDGLLVLYDGIENVGWGEHDGNASAWVDLAGTLDPAQYQSGTIVADDHAYNPDGTQIATNSAQRTLRNIPCPCYEIVMSVDSRDLASGITRVLDLKRDDWYGLVVGTSHGAIGFGNFLTGTEYGNTYNGVTVSTYYVEPTGVDWTRTNSFSLCHYVDPSLGTDYPRWNTWDKYHPDDLPLVLVNGERRTVDSSYWSGNRYVNAFTIGNNISTNEGCLFRGKIYCIRVYDRYLTDEERLVNYAVDKARFNLS